MVDSATPNPDCDIDAERFWFSNHISLLAAVYEAVFDASFTLYTTELASLLDETVDCRKVAKMSVILNRAQSPAIWWTHPHQLVGRIDFELLQVGLDFGKRLVGRNSYVARSVEMSRYLFEFPDSLRGFHNVEPEQLEMMVRLAAKARIIVDELTAVTQQDAEQVFVPFVALKKLASGLIETSWSRLTLIEELLSSPIEIQKTMARLLNLEQCPDLRNVFEDLIPLLARRELMETSMRSDFALLDEWSRTNVNDWSRCLVMMQVGIANIYGGDRVNNVEEWNQVCQASTDDSNESINRTENVKDELELVSVEPAIVRFESVLSHQLQCAPWLQQAIRSAVMRSSLPDHILQVLTNDIIQEQVSCVSDWLILGDILAVRGIDLIAYLEMSDEMNRRRVGWMRDLLVTWNRAMFRFPPTRSRLLDAIFSMADDEIQEMKMFAVRYQADYTLFKSFSDVYSAFMGYFYASLLETHVLRGNSALLDFARAFRPDSHGHSIAALRQPLAQHDLVLLRNALQRSVELINTVRRSNIIVSIYSLWDQVFTVLCLNQPIVTCSLWSRTLRCLKHSKSNLPLSDAEEFIFFQERRRQGDIHFECLHEIRYNTTSFPRSLNSTTSPRSSYVTDPCYCQVPIIL